VNGMGVSMGHRVEVIFHLAKDAIALCTGKFAENNQEIPHVIIPKIPTELTHGRDVLLGLLEMRIITNNWQKGDHVRETEE